MSGIACRAVATVSLGPSVRTPIMAMRRYPIESGLVTATTCITPLSMRRCTRWRTAASDRPTAAPSRV